MSGAGMIRRGTLLLRQEILSRLASGWTLDPEEKASGFVFNPYSGEILEMEVRLLKSTGGGDLSVFMTCEGDVNDYSMKEAEGNSGNDGWIPGWFVLDEAFYGLLVPTLLSIHDALIPNTVHYENQEYNCL